MQTEEQDGPFPHDAPDQIADHETEKETATHSFVKPTTSRIVQNAVIVVLYVAVVE